MNNEDSSRAHLAKQVQRIDLDGAPIDLWAIPSAALPELPESCREIAVIRAHMNLTLVTDFAERYLSAEERRELKRYSQDAFFPKSQRDRWDDYLIEEAAEQHGAGILLSDHVMSRVWAWTRGEVGGFGKLERLYNKMKKSALIRLGEAKGRVTDQGRQSMDAFVPEITELQIRLRKEWPESPNQIRTFVQTYIETSPAMVHLKRNAPQLINYLRDDAIARDFRGGDSDRITLTPTQFFIKWLAASKNRVEESVRQDLYSEHR